MNKVISLAAATALILTPTLSTAQQLPAGGSVAAGSATISSPNANTLNVNQSSNRAVINWSGFSVGQGDTVNFNQPGASSATLNRVTGSAPSSIAGTINAPGTVMLVNPNGIAITKNGVVNVGSFAASTLDISNDDFMSGKYKFTGNGASAGVTNAGRINVADGGFAALLGGHVANDGIISARLGKVGLGSGELMTLDLSGDGFLSVAVPTLNGIVGADGKPLVSNKGKIRADGGTVYLSAATAAGLLRDAVHVPGSIRANSVGTRDGKIVIGGGAGGKVTVSGKVKASGGKTAKGGTIDISGAQVGVSGKVKANGTSGGTVKVTGTESADISGEVSAKGSTGSGGTVIIAADAITVNGTAKLDVSGATGGLLLIGGDYQGGVNAANNFSIEPIETALTTTIAAGATLSAAGISGDGGRIVVWADDVTTFAGHVDVGSTGGQGGFAEVSGHRLLDFAGTANLAGTTGAGTLLLDPRNITISTGTDYNHDSSFAANGDNSVINVTTLQNALASGNVIVTTGGAGSLGAQAGDITVASDLTWSANTLTLQAYRSIYVNATMAATGTAGLTLTTNNGGSGGVINFAGKATFASTSQSLIINGASYTLIDSMSALQNINSNLTGNYALINSLDASAVSNWIPIGTDGAGNILGSPNPSIGGFNGQFSGLGNSIAGLTIDKPGVQYIGLFGSLSTGSSVSSVNLLTAIITGGDQVGGLIGSSRGTVSDVYVSGVVSGTSHVGGVVGYGYGSIADAHTNASVSSNHTAGGIAGSFAGTSIVRSSAAGSVSVLGSIAGGLVGDLLLSTGSITDSYSTAAVSGSANLGGLVGEIDTSFSILNSWSSGRVTGSSTVGGVAGRISHLATPIFSNVYWDTQTTGQAYGRGGSTAAVAGTTGLTSTQARTQSSYSGFDFTNTWYMQNGDTRPFLRSEYSTTITNAHQLQLINMNATTLAASYKLNNDINLGAALSNASEMWGSRGWVPLGTDGSGNVLSGGGFSGNLDGQYHFVDGLTINRAASKSGLIGYQTIGAVSKIGLTNVNIAGGSQTGGLVGWLYSGTLSDSFVTGRVNGEYQVGGLVGENDTNASILRTYAQAYVSGSGSAIGGLVGQNAGTISQSYAAGRVTGVGATGLTGAGGTVTNSYYDNLMFGSTSGAGTGYVTAQMQSALGGFDSTYWGVVSGRSYFYLKGFYDGTPQVISGNAYTIGSVSANAGAQVNALINGTAAGSSYSGANGYFNILLPSGAIAADSQVAVYTTGTYAGLTLKHNASGSQNFADIYGNELRLEGSATALSPYTAALLTAIGSSGVSTSYANLRIASNASSLVIDEAINVSGNVQISINGDLTQTAGSSITAATLRISNFGGGAPKNTTLLDSGNNIVALGTVLAGNGGSFSVYSGVDLAVERAIVADGGLLIRTAGRLTLAGGVTLSSTAAGDAVVLSAGTTFVNNAGGGAISTPNGRWIVYAGTPAGSTFNNLNSNNAAIWNSTYANNAPSTIASGNRYVFALQPTLTFTSTNASKFYGQTADVSSNYTVTSNASAVTNAFTVDAGSYTGTPTLTSAGAVGTATVAGGPYAINIAQGSVTSAYALNFVSSGMLTVNKANLVIYGGTPPTKTYGDTYSSTSDYSAQGLHNSDTVTSVTLTSAGAAATADVGNYALTPSNAVGTGLSNYNIIYSDGTLSVGQAVLNIAAANKTKQYGLTYTFAGTEFTSSGLVNGDTISGVTLTSTGAAATANAGGHQIVVSNATGAKISNYLIFYSNGSMSVTPAPLTVTAINQSKTYGDTANLGTTGVSITSGALVNGDTLTGATLTSPGGAPAAAGVGGYSLFASAATGSGISNYNITYIPGTLQVDKRALVISANAVSRIYGDANPTTGTATGDNLVNGDTITGVNLTSPATATSGVGGYNLTGSNATGSGLSNYTITYATVTNGLTVTPRALIITADNVSRVYGDVNPASGTATGDNLVNGDTIASVTLSSPATTTSNVGTYALTGSDAVFGSGSASNYAITYATVPNGLTVTQAALTLTITPTAVSKVYGDAYNFAGTEFTPVGLTNGDTISGVTLTSTGAAATASVGQYDIGSSNAVFSSGSALNYNITYNVLAGGLTVTARPLIITASSASRVYGDANPAGGTATGDNLVNGDTIAGVSLTSPATAASGVGSYNLTGSNATGTGLSNYAISYATVTNGLTVTPRALVVTANGVSRAYGDANPTTGAATGDNLVNGDTITGVSLTSPAAVTSGVGGYDLTGSAAVFGNGSASNYSISYATVANGLTVTPRALTVTANGVSRIYGDANPATGTATGDNLVNGDTIAGVSLTSPATAASGVGSYNLTGSNATGTGLSNYAISYATVTNGLTVTPRALVVTANGVSRAYGDANPASGTATGDNLVNGDTIASVSLTSPAAVTSGVGGYDLTGSAAVFGNGSASNYSISYATVASGLTVTPRALVITANNVSRIYGDANPTTGTAIGDNLVNGDTIASVSLTSPATVTSGLGGYDLTGSAAVFGNGLASNYSISYATVTNGLTVTPRALVITANGVSRAYGDANPTTGSATGDNLVNGDSISGVNLTSPATVTSGVGSYALTGSAATGTGLANYVITYATVANGLTVTPRPLVITANNVSRAYGDANPATGTATGDNLVNGDSIAGVSLSSPATTASNVGTYALTGSNAVFGYGSSSNYAITYATVPNGLTVTAAMLTLSITPNAASKVYGDTLNFAGTEYSQVGLVNGDTISGVTLISAGAAAAAGVGQYDIASSNAVFSSGSAGNYNITYNVLTNGLTVTPRALIVTANSASRVYGDANPTTGTATGDNLVNGDTITGISLTSPATATSGVGGYDLTGSAATGTGLGNYTITYATVANGLTVTPRALIVSANGVSRIYGNANTATGTATGDNLVNGDTITGVSLSSPASAASGVGSYALTGSAATGTGLGNYTITYATVANGLTVTPRALIVNVNSVSRIYGDANPATGTATGDNLVNGDMIAGVTLNTPATAASGVGSYALTGSAATGTGLGNYTITYATVANGLTVTPRALVVTANGVSRVYGDANPATGTAIGDNLVNGDSITGVSLTSPATSASGVGSYSLTGSAAAGTGLGNYTITYATVANGLTVTPRALIVTANSVSRIYGDANPSSGTAIGDNLVNGDSITGISLSSPATAASGVGGYNLTGSNATGTGLGNYTITYATVANGLTVTPRALIVTANSLSRIYGDANPASGTAIGDSLVNGDTVTGVNLSSPATAASGVGGYNLTGSNATGTGLGNYTITYATVANGLTVTPRALIVTANGVSRVYGDANPATGTATGDNLVNGDTIAGVTLNTPATGASGVGSYALTGSAATGTGLGNYAITYATVANGLTVTPRALTVSADAKSKLVGDADPLLSYRITSGSLVNSDTLTGALARNAGESEGIYAILQGTLAASSNYSLAYVGANLTITTPPPAPVNDGDYATSWYIAPPGGGGAPVVNISFQPNTAGAPVISVVNAPNVAANPPANTNIAAVDPAQNIAPAGGPLDLFVPISQFDRTQYVADTLPGFAPEASQAAVLTMVARAGLNNRAEPKINTLWGNGGASWPDANGAIGKTAQFGDGNGAARQPAGDNGFAFVNGTTDVAALLKSGPVMLGGAKIDGASTPWLLALQMTADGKGIIANDPLTGRQVVLAYDPATKTVGAVTGIIDPATRRITPLGDTAPAGVAAPPAAWGALSTFKPVSYFAVTL